MKCRTWIPDSPPFSRTSRMTQNIVMNAFLILCHFYIININLDPRSTEDDVKYSREYTSYFMSILNLQICLVIINGLK
jgi:hypothetical protein